MTESNSKSPEAVIEHPAQRFAREVGARSVQLPTQPAKVNIFAKTDVRETWKRFGWSAA